MRSLSGVDNSPTSVLVTGAAGFIGAHVCDELLGLGHRVVGVDRVHGSYAVGQKHANLAKLIGRTGFEFHQLDVGGPWISKVIERSEIVIHLAGKPGVRESWGRGFEDYVTDNILATQRLLEAATSADLRKFVFASSSSIYGNGSHRASRETDEPQPVSPYGVSKLAAERLCLAYEAQHDLPTVSLRFFTVYGPSQRPDMAIARFIDRIERGDEVELHDGGRPVRELTFVGDVVDAVIRAAFAEARGTVINVGGGVPVTVLEMATAVADVLERPLLMKSTPLGRGDATQTWCDHTRARELLGYHPRTNLREGIKAQVDERARVSAKLAASN